MRSILEKKVQAMVLLIFHFFLDGWAQDGGGGGRRQDNYLVTFSLIAMVFSKYMYWYVDHMSLSSQPLQTLEFYRQLAGLAKSSANFCQVVGMVLENQEE